MDEPDDALQAARHGWRGVKFVMSGLLALGIGIWQISLGDKPNLIAGGGACLAGIVILGFVVRSLVRRSDPQSGKTPPSGELSPANTVWLGILLSTLPGPMYWYLRNSMPQFETKDFVFVMVPVLLGGLGLIVTGLFFSGSRPSSGDGADEPDQLRHE